MTILWLKRRLTEHEQWLPIAGDLFSENHLCIWDTTLLFLSTLIDCSRKWVGAECHK